MLKNRFKEFRRKGKKVLDSSHLTKKSSPVVLFEASVKRSSPSINVVITPPAIVPGIVMNTYCTFV